MKTIFTFSKFIALSAATLPLTAALSRAAVVTVTPSNMQGWEVTEYDDSGSNPGGTVSFVNGPATPPLGTGSLRMTVSALGDGAVKLDTANFDGTRLDALTTLQYSTYVTHNNGGGAQDDAQAPYVQIPIHYGDMGEPVDQVDDRLFFEPVYQTGTYSTVAGVNPSDVPDQRGADGHAPKVGTWETYDILHGGVWTDQTGNGGPPLNTISHILSLHPDSTIISNGGVGGFQLEAGFGGPGDWGNFDGNVDAVVFGTAAGTTTYDFEPTSVPEPTSLGLLGMGALVALRRRR